MIRQRSWDWRRIWWSRGFFQAWNLKNPLKGFVWWQSQHKPYFEANLDLSLVIWTNNRKCSSLKWPRFSNHETELMIIEHVFFHFNSDQNDKYKFDKEESIKRILGLSIQTKYTEIFGNQFRNSPMTCCLWISTLHKGDRRNSNRRKQSLIESMLDPLALFQVPTEIKEEQNPKKHSVDINLVCCLIS